MCGWHWWVGWMVHSDAVATLVPLGAASYCYSNQAPGKWANE